MKITKYKEHAVGSLYIKLKNKQNNLAMAFSAVATFTKSLGDEF